MRSRQGRRSATDARGRPPLHKIRHVSNFIRQIFNGRTRNETYCVSCDVETRFDGRPKGVRSTDGVTKKRTTERIVFPRVSAIERVQRPFLPYLFPQEGKDMVAEGTVAVSPQKQHCGAIAEAPRACGADNLRTPCAKIPRILRTRSLRACGAACAQRAQNRHPSSGVTKLRPSGAENY